MRIGDRTQNAVASSTGRASRRGALAALLMALSGCSLIYDGDGFQYRDAAIDYDTAPIDAFVPADIDLSALELTDTAPATLFEGAGCLPDGESCGAGSRAVPVVVYGTSIAPDATVTLDGAGFDHQTVAATVAVDGTMAAFAIPVPVMPALGDGATSPITITVSQGDFTDQLVLDVTGLDEFRASVDAAGGTFEVSQIVARYSTVDFDLDLTLTGAGPARFVATAAIALDAPVRVDGASGDDGGAAGPGGCAGGVPEAPGQCPGGGGGAGGTNDGGGGGGGGEVGTTGAGSTGGAGGGEVGDPTLTPLIATGTAAPRGNGGGGGGDGSLAGTGGAGGGGGGVIELSSEGRLVIGAGGAVSAAGGAGSSGTGTCVLNQHGGGGGGGAGGAILARGLLAVEDQGSGARLAVGGGAGGDAGSNCNAGGAGAPGRARVDSPSGQATPAFASGITTFYRGPVLDPATPAVVTQATPTLTVFGGVGQSYWVGIDGDDLVVTTIDENYAGTAQVMLQPGRNVVCARVAETANVSQPEGRNCLAIAYIEQ